MTDSQEALAVTALCLTRGRRHFLPTAIDCFLSQTYPHKRLAIIADEPTDIAGLIPANLAIQTLVLNRHLTIGTKRNIGGGCAETPLLASWDDDDLSGPDRLAFQVDRLISTKKAVTGLVPMPVVFVPPVNPAAAH